MYQDGKDVATKSWPKVEGGEGHKDAWKSGRFSSRPVGQERLRGRGTSRAEK